MRPAEGLAQTSHVLWQEQVVMSPTGKRWDQKHITGNLIPVIMKELRETGVEHINELFRSYSIFLKHLQKTVKGNQLRPILCHCTWNQQLFISCHFFTWLEPTNSARRTGRGQQLGFCRWEPQQRYSQLQIHQLWLLPGLWATETASPLKTWLTWRTLPSKMQQKAQFVFRVSS